MNPLYIRKKDLNSVFLFLFKMASLEVCSKEDDILMWLES